MSQDKIHEVDELYIFIQLSIWVYLQAWIARLFKILSKPFSISSHLKLYAIIEIAYSTTVGNSLFDRKSKKRI